MAGFREPSSSVM